MNREHAFPRRKQAAQGRAARGSQTASPKRAGDPSQGFATREALDVARYVADLTAQLEALAVAADLDLVAYFRGHGQGGGRNVRSNECRGRGGARSAALAARMTNFQTVPLPTAWLLAQKLRRSMVDPDREPLEGVVEVDQ